ncbi:LytTR family DNA-binding domain-containing protein [Thalassobacillus hwangdonensis]|uniref:LytTR family DNA-binding domain-containing protein n=1 Tax=Thalassobacillus hwangdonensis TaxID=546108 RepID=A0ABW3KZF6_9BACI
MKVILDIHEKHKESSITIKSGQLDDTIEEILEIAKKDSVKFILGKQGNSQHLLKPDTIHYFQADGDKIVAFTQSSTYMIKEKLYELEQLLPSTSFIRLSKALIANLQHVSHFEPSFNGTLGVHFRCGRKEYASRHYVGALKEILNNNRRDKK